MFILLSQALAQPVPVAALETAAKVTKVKVGVGVLGQAGGAFLDQPSDRTASGASEELPYSAMAGVAPGAGVSFDARFFDVVGLELNVIHSRDTAWSHYRVDGEQVDFRVRQPAWHMPVLAKFVLPGVMVRPNLQLGAQVIVPTRTALEVDGRLPFDLSAQAEPYAVWMVGAGVEVKLPVPNADVRLPIALRAGFNTPESARAMDRALYALDADGYVQSMQLDSRWTHHVTLTAGLTWYWPK